jgi:hypothetical protein
MINTASIPENALLKAVAQLREETASGSKQKAKVAGDRIRWEAPSNGSKIRIMRCGSKVKGQSNVLMEISATGKYKDLYPSWKQALEQRAERMSATGSNRVSHKGLDSGLLPKAEDK